MIITQKVLIVEKIKKDYSFEGKSGTSLAIRCLIGTDVFRLKTTADILDKIENGNTYNVDMSIRTVKEQPILELVAVHAK